MKRFLTLIADRKFIWVRTLFIGVFVALMIAIGISVPSPSVAQTRRQVSDFNSFADLCLNKESLPGVTRHTVYYLLFNMHNNDCIMAGKELGEREYIYREEINTDGGLRQFFSPPPISDISPLRFAPNLTELTLSGAYIVDLSPLKFLPKLTDLTFFPSEYGLSAIDFNINELNALDPLTNLTRLVFSTRLISDISPLKSHTKLTTLKFSSNSLVSDISSLESLTNLKELFIKESRVSDLSPLQSLTKLSTLNLSCTLINNIEPLKSLINLEYLALNSAPIKNIFPLGSLSKLKGLSITRLNSHPDITALQTLTNLRNLYLGSSEVTDISPLRSLTKLVSLDLTGNKVSDVSPLQSLANLEYLSLAHNPVVDITPLLFLPKLKRLVLDSSQIANIKPPYSQHNKIIQNYNMNEGIVPIEIPPQLSDCGKL
ncbi:hypothetical protein TUMEXPCC7403_10350 [Tumidithrix helvetica PCC 7403]|uniref:leucine-rich repeat domain-containing protein n=1 Tax=Tumidithrix helvetica TaxID=3457545 RepID=UPI003CB5A84D